MREASPFPNITSRNPFGLFSLKSFLFDQIDAHQGRDVFCLQNIYRGVIRNEAGTTKDWMKNKKAFAYTHTKQNKTKQKNGNNGIQTKQKKTTE
jgi:hypothetical protein